MYKATLTILFCGAMSLSFSASAAPQCEKNLTVQGGFLKGRVFKSWAEIEGLDPKEAYTNVYLNIVKDGWKVSSSDKEMGIISAGSEVSYGAGKSAPLNIIVEGSGESNTKISISFAVSGGVSASQKDVLKSFCQTIAEANTRK